jgi:hypothetical protein
MRYREKVARPLFGERGHEAAARFGIYVAGDPHLKARHLYKVKRVSRALGASAAQGGRGARLRQQYRPPAFCVEMAVRLVQVPRQDYVDPALFKERERAAEPADRLLVFKTGRLHERVVGNYDLYAVIRDLAYAVSHTVDFAAAHAPPFDRKASRRVDPHDENIFTLKDGVQVIGNPASVFFAGR